MTTKRAGERRFYVYALLDPRTGTAFYIGKGCNQRMHHHFRDFLAGRCTNALKTAYIADIVAAGQRPVASILHSGMTEREALDREGALIRRYRPALTNYRAADPWAYARAWATEALKRVKPFDRWLKEKPKDIPESTYAELQQNLEEMAVWGLQ